MIVPGAMIGSIGSNSTKNCSVSLHSEFIIDTPSHPQQFLASEPKMMFEKGIAATIGPVGEHYVQAFPVLEIFFGFLVDGYLSLAECYLVSIPYPS